MIIIFSRVFWALLLSLLAYGRVWTPRVQGKINEFWFALTLVFKFGLSGLSGFVLVVYLLKISPSSFLSPTHPKDLQLSNDDSVHLHFINLFLWKDLVNRPVKAHHSFTPRLDYLLYAAKLIILEMIVSSPKHMLYKALINTPYGRQIMVIIPFQKHRRSQKKNKSLTMVQRGNQ